MNLIEEAIKRGYVPGVNVRCLSSCFRAIETIIDGGITDCNGDVWVTTDCAYGEACIYKSETDQWAEIITPKEGFQTGLKVYLKELREQIEKMEGIINSGKRLINDYERDISNEG